MKQYRCKHVVEAMRWYDTAENRALFAAWFASHGATFETIAAIVVLADECGEASEGEWLTYWDGEFVVMDDESFMETYEPATSSKGERG